MGPVLPNVTYDAVLIVPGIMGTTLYDGETGDTLWGFEDPLDYVRLWGTGGSLKKLHLKMTANGVVSGPVDVGHPIREPSWAPLAKGTFGYEALIDAAKRAVVDPVAVGEFGYDWRLSVEHNARELAKAASEHLRKWRAHDVHRLGPQRPQPRLVFVAHSMGGLIARALPLVEATGEVPVVSPDVRSTITLGTPFQGAVKAVLMLAAGEGGPKLMMRRRLKKLAATLPGVYDLLPTYRCVPVADRNGTITDVRRVTPEDIETLGGDLDLARRAIAFAEQLREVPLRGHLASFGTEQPTLHTVRFKGGMAMASERDFEWVEGELLRYGDGSVAQRDRDGDGTVSRDCASTSGADTHPIAQQHGALHVAPESLATVRAALKPRSTGDRLGVGEFGIDVPDAVRPRESWAIRVTGVTSPTSAECEVIDVASDRRVANPRIAWVDGAWQAMTRIPAPGLYEVRLSGGGASPVRQVVLAAPDDE